MNELEFRKALVELQSFRQNMPDGDIEDRDVYDYHHLFETVQNEMGLDLANFRIPLQRLEQQVTSISPPTRFNRWQSKKTYTDSRYCDRDLFLRKLDAAIIYINGLLPQPTRSPIGF